MNIRNEARVLNRNPLIWITLALIGGFSLLIAKGSPPEPGSSAVAELLRLNLFIPAFMLPFFAGAIGPIIYLREVEHGVAELLGSYPITARQWLKMRFGYFVFLLVAACLLAQLVFLAVLAPQYAGQLVSLLGHSALWLVVLLIPSCLIWASVLAWLACQRAHGGLLYFVAGLGWMSYLGIASMTGSPLMSGSVVIWPPLKQALLVFDPYAVTAMASPMPEGGPLQWRWFNVALGRLFWLALCLVIMRRITDVPARAAGVAVGSSAVAPVGTGSVASEGRIGHIGIHLQYFVKDRVFPLIVLGWFALLLPEAYGGIDYAEPLSRITPDSRDALNRVVWDVLPLSGAMLLLYAADRICRFYPATRMNELYAATPHSMAKLIAVQLASLWIVALGSIALAGLAVVLAQFIAHSPVQPAEYVLQLGLTAPRLLLFAMLFVAVHGLIRPRFLANLLCLLLIVQGLSNLAPALGLHHPLWRPFQTPLALPDHYWGFAGSLTGHAAFLLFWLAVCLFALLLAVAIGNRTLPSAQSRLRTIVRHPETLLAMASLGAAILQGGRVDRDLRVVGSLQTSDDRAALRADYERGYARWQGTAQPDIVEIRSRVEFYPQQYRARLRGTMRLLNRSDQPVEQLLVGWGQPGEHGAVNLAGAKILSRDSRLGQTVFQLDHPLLPQRDIDLRFTVERAQTDLEPAELPFAIRPEFSSLPMHSLLPVIGFKRELTLRDPVTRRELGLPALNIPPPSRVTVTVSNSLAADRVMLDTVVSTDRDQQAVAQGSLLRRWQVQGRAYFHYRTDQPIRNLAAVFSVPWTPQSWPAGPYQIESYSPQLLRGADPNILAMHDTLIWLGREVAPYRGDSLRLLAVPESGPSGYALPQVVQISHRLGFRARPQTDAGFNQLYRRAAHETAHQWFGHSVGHGILEERAFLIESLAKYVELVMIERRYGHGASRALVEFERDRYRQARLDPAQAIAALIDAEETEDMYSRATLAFACLRGKIGDRPIVAALKSLFVNQEATGRPATSLAFVLSLKASSTSEFAPLIDRLFLSPDPILSVETKFGCAARRP